MIIDEYDLDEYTRDELIEIILEQNNDIIDLELELKELKKENTEKSAKEYEENKCLVSTLLTNLVKEVE